MKFANLLISLVVGVALSCAATVRGETADEAFARGNTLLANGDLQKALQAYSTAVRAQRNNQQYSQQFMLVRRAVALRQSLGRETDPKRWQRTARALRAFYISQGLYREALPVDEKIHARLNTASSAVQLAETQLAVGNNAAAARVLATLGPKGSTAATQAMLAVALARQGRMADARKIAGTTSPPKKAGPGTLYSLARMHAIVGHQEQALALLIRSFEAVPPSRLDNLKTHAKQSPEFAALASTAGFAQALRAKSKVAESKCSGGSSCAGCPMRGKCSKSHGS